MTPKKGKKGVGKEKKRNEKWERKKKKKLQARCIVPPPPPPPHARTPAIPFPIRFVSLFPLTPSIPHFPPFIHQTLGMVVRFVSCFSLFFFCIIHYRYSALPGLSSCVCVCVSVCVSVYACVQKGDSFFVLDMIRIDRKSVV